MDVSAGGDTQRIDGEIVTANYFSLLGVRPTVGRDFTSADEQAGSTPSVILSRRLARNTFGSDGAALGKALLVNGRQFTVVGVAPAGFQGRSLMTASDLWMPLGSYMTLQTPKSAALLLTSRRSAMFGDAIARLRPGVTLAQAQAEADAVMVNLPDFANRSPTPGARSNLGAVFYPGVGVPEPSTQERIRTVFGLLMGGVALLLLLACANAANLLLARATGRRREIAVCQAIGASRFRIVRQQLVEGLVLSLTAGLAGLVLARWLTWFFDGMRVLSFLPAVEGVSIDWRVCAFAMAASVLTGVVFATAPAFVSSRVDLQSSLKDGVTSSRGGRRWLRSGLVLTQVAVSVLLLVAAGLFIRTLQNIRGLDLGIQSDGIVGLGIQPDRFGLSPERSSSVLM
jgi:predicted permease